MGTPGSVPRRLPHLVVLALVLSACGIDEDVVARRAAETGPGSTTTATTAAPAEPPPPAWPVAVAEVPDGYEPVLAGPGEDDTDGIVPVTVLAPGGEPVGPGVVLVEAVGDDGDGGEVGRWTSLTGDGIRVWGVDAPEADLRAVLDAAQASEPGRAPTVADPPGDLEVVGSLAADGVVALRAAWSGDADGPVPGPATAQVAVWATGDGSLLVMTLPAGSLDPVAVATEVRPPRRAVDEERDAVAEEVEVGGEVDATGVVTTTARSGTGAVVRRELAVELPWGDVLVVISRGAEVLDAGALVAVAGSVTRG